MIDYNSIGHHKAGYIQSEGQHMGGESTLRFFKRSVEHWEYFTRGVVILCSSQKHCVQCQNHVSSAQAENKFNSNQCQQTRAKHL